MIISIRPKLIELTIISFPSRICILTNHQLCFTNPKNNTAKSSTKAKENFLSLLIPTPNALAEIPRNKRQLMNAPKNFKIQLSRKFHQTARTSFADRKCIE